MLILICFVFGFITSIIAASKNKNVFGWFAIGCLFPLLGIILAVVLPPNPNPALAAPEA